jgi:hypothetical protein
MIVLEKMLDAAEAPSGSGSSSSSSSSSRNLKRACLLQEVESGALTEDRVEASLNQAVARMEAESALQAMADDAAAGGKRVRLFLAINPLKLPDPLPPRQPISAAASAAAAAAAAAAESSSSGGVIDLSGDDAMDVDAAIEKLVSDRGDTEYKDIKCGKPGVRIWIV